MCVTVRLFARLRDIVGAAQLSRELPEGATAHLLWNMLAAEHAGLPPTATPYRSRSTPNTRR